ncbi:MAG: hypothetical protein AAFR01_04340 [Pseudomonadota bacterium]
MSTINQRSFNGAAALMLAAGALAFTPVHSAQAAGAKSVVVKKVAHGKKVKIVRSRTRFGSQKVVKTTFDRHGRVHKRVAKVKPRAHRKGFFGRLKYRIRRAFK